MRTKLCIQMGHTQLSPWELYTCFWIHSAKGHQWEQQNTDVNERDYETEGERKIDIIIVTARSIFIRVFVLCVHVCVCGGGGEVYERWKYATPCLYSFFAYIVITL